MKVSSFWRLRADQKVNATRIGKKAAFMLALIKKSRIRVFLPKTAITKYDKIRRIVRRYATLELHFKKRNLFAIANTTNSTGFTLFFLQTKYKIDDLYDYFRLLHEYIITDCSKRLEKANLLGLQEFNPEDVQVGDIVVYNAAWHKEPVIHRVIKIGQINGTTVYEIKGDNNNAPDPYYVTPSQITSRVVTINGQPLIIPKIGYISIWIRGL